MKIKELLKICEEAPNKEREVYIPHTMFFPTSETIKKTNSTNIGHNFDDNCDLDLYVTAEED